MKAWHIARYHGKTEVYMWFKWGNIMERNHTQDTFLDGTIVLRRLITMFPAGHRLD